MATIYITKQGAVLRKIGERLKVMYRSDVLLDLPLIHVEHVVIFGKASVTAAAVQTLLEKEIEICYLTQRGRFVGRLAPAVAKNVVVRRLQYKAAFDAKRTLEFAKGFVHGKLANMRTLLMRQARELSSKDCAHAASRMKTALEHARKAKTIEQLRGHEGDGSAAYFGAFKHFLKTRNFVFEKRVRRPPTDPVNVLLSFGYTLLLNDLFGAVNMVGFDPYVGYLHAERYGRASLPLDLMEEFRSIVVDSVVLTCLNKGILKTADFTTGIGRVCELTETGRERFLEQYDLRKQTTFQHPVLNQQITYQQCFEQQARFLAKALHGELKTYPPLVVK